MSQKPKLKKPLRQRLLQLSAVMALLLVALYFALTSSWFVRKFVLPAVGGFIGAEITVTELTLRPFSRLELRDLRVQAGQQEPVLEVGELRARYNGWALLRGRVVVGECALVAPRVQFIHDELGRNNLPSRFAKTSAAAPKPYQPASGTAGRWRVAVRNLSLTNARVDLVERDRDGALRSTIISNLMASLDRIENGEPGKLTLAANLHCEHGLAGGASNDFFTAHASSEFAFETTPALVLSRLAGGAQFEVHAAGGGMRELAGVTGRLESLLEGRNLSKFDLAFEQRGARLGTLGATGTFDPAKSEGQLRLTLDSINRPVLNLLTARRGIEFLPSAIGGAVVVNLAQGGRAVTAEGQLRGRQLSVRRIGAGEGTPPVDADAGFDLRVDRAAQRLSLQKFQLSVKQGAAELVAGRLDYPMEFSWATNSASSFTKSTLTLALRQCDLVAWRALHGLTNLAGRCDAQVSLTAAPGGERLQLTAGASARDLVLGSARQRQLELGLNATYAVTNGAEVVSGTATLGCPAAGAGDAFPAGFKADAQFELLRQGGALELRPCVVRASHNGASGGTMELEGRHHAEKGAGEFQLKLAAVNERVLAPFLVTALAPRALASATLDGAARLKLDPGGRAATDADLRLANFRLAAPGAAADAPLSAALKLSAESHGAAHQLKQALLDLAPGAAVTNAVELTGALDLGGAATASNRLVLKSAQLDVTPWWDAFAPPMATIPAGKGATPASTSAPPRDPAPLQLPVKQLAVDVNVGRLVAREIVLSNLVVSARLSDGLLAVKPLEATLNGAPVSGLIDANLGVSGWLYNLDLKLDRVPLRPLAASFSPAAAGTLSGELTLDGGFKGAGLSYETLRHKLNGTARFSLTNAAIEFAPGWKQGVLVAVAALLRAPEIAGGPIAWAAGGVTLGGGQLDLQGVNVGTEAFLAGVTGRVPLAEALTNSALDLPVTLQLRRALADRAKLAVAGPSDAPFAALPDFLRAKGTLGVPRADINKLALGGVLLQSLGNVPGLGDDKTRAIFQGLGGLLTPTKPAATNAPAAAPPSPPAPAPRP